MNSQATQIMLDALARAEIDILSRSYFKKYNFNPSHATSWRKFEASLDRNLVRRATLAYLQKYIEQMEYAEPIARFQQYVLFI